LKCKEVWGGVRAADTQVSVPDVDVLVYSQPYGDSVGGGDIYYVSLCNQGELSRFILADVMGHGQKVAGLAEDIRDLMARHIGTASQMRFVQQLNEAMTAAGDEPFATAVVASLHQGSSNLLLCNAGHPRPLWYSTKDETWRLADHTLRPTRKRAGNVPLGIIRETGFHQYALNLSPGDLVVMYTDSLIEATSSTGRALGENGLLKMAEHFDPDQPDQLVRGLLIAVSEWRKQLAPQDDVTILALHYVPDDGSRGRYVGEQ
jgi:serine phosphatase RsbU (regulator of sigma subunit)